MKPSPNRPAEADDSVPETGNGQLVGSEDVGLNVGLGHLPLHLPTIHLALEGLHSYQDEKTEWQGD